MRRITPPKKGSKPMPSGYSFFVDTTLCTGCRGCQTACKQWNQNPSKRTTQTGTYQNPPDLNVDTFKLVRFNEEKVEGENPKAFFFPDQCRHCLYPLCKVAADAHAPGAVTIDPKTRAIIFDPEIEVSPEAFEEIRAMCPFDIPRYDEETAGMNKCTMCNDRVSAGMEPACVQACPTGAMAFGERGAILEQARDRASHLRQTDGRAALIDPELTRVIFLVTDRPDKYHKFALAKPFGGLTRKAALKSVFGIFASIFGKPWSRDA